MMHAARISFIRLMVWAALTPGLSATTRNVPADFSTVQAAINAATSGDTVLVQPGRYKENIDFGTKNLVVASRFLVSGDPDDVLNTILDGSSPTSGDSASVVRITGAQDQTTLLMGFTITGGHGTKWRDVSDHLLYREGGGILIEGGKPVIAANYIVNNDATNKVGTTSAGGGGIRAGFGDSVTIVGNIIAYNQGLYGAGIVAFHCPATITNNVIWGNSGGQDFGGSGIWMIESNPAGAPSYIINNTIVNNSSVLQGGGIRLATTVGYIYNNIIRGNTGSGASQMALSGANAGTTVSYNDIQGGYPGLSNTDEDPAFAPNNFLLTPTSPCVDSGDPSAAYYDKEDPIHPGSALDPSLGTVRNDKGAYGGPNTLIHPLFTSPRFDVIPDTLDFGYLPIGVPQDSFVRYTKSGFVPMRIDSVKLQNSHNDELYWQSPMPRVIGAAPGLDSLRLTWQPSAKGIITDTAYIFHSAPDQINPVAVFVRGRAHNCCTGTTGNVDLIGIVDGADLATLVAFLTGQSGGFGLPCTDEANVNGTGIVDSADLAKLVGYLTISGTVLPSCP